MEFNGYYCPVTLEEAKALLDKSPENTKVLAGGTDLIIQMRRKSLEPRYILDLGGVDSLKKIYNDGNHLIIGSMASFNQIEKEECILRYLPALAQAAASVGSPQIRTRATIGGNIANAAPAADTVTALLALNTSIELQSMKGVGIVRLNEVILGINKTSIKPEEIITKIIVPLPETNTYQSFKKIGRRKAMAIARINLALVVTFYPGNEIIKEAKVAIGAVGTTPYRVKEVEELLTGNFLDKTLIAGASDQIEEVVVHRLSTRPTVEYKKTIAKEVLREALADVVSKRDAT